MKSEPTAFHRYFPIGPRDRKWGLFVTTIGEILIPAHSGYPPPGHPKGYAFDWRRGRTLQHYALVYISRGSGTFENDRGRTHEIQSGHVMLLFPDVWHRYMPNQETGWHEHWIGFDGKMARDWEANGFISRKRPVWKSNAEDLLYASFTGAIQAVKASRPAIQQIMAGAASQIIGLLYSAQQSTPAIKPNENVVEKAIVRFQADLASNFSMQDLSREIGVSYRSFRSIFTRHTGMSPHQYLLELRILRARNLLAETDCKIKEVAAKAGFEDEHYFSRLFRSRIGVSPREWRIRSGARARE